MSVATDAPVGDELGTASVCVSLMWILEIGISSSIDATWIYNNKKPH